jgi:Chaperone of endosialidase
MKLKTLGAAISFSLALSPMIANADDVDCGASGTCALPGDTSVVNGAGINGVVKLTLDNTITPWIIAADDGGLGIGQVIGNLPFILVGGAPKNALVIAGNGNVGITNNLGAPSAPLHVRRNNGTARVLVQESSSTTASRPLLDLSNNGPIGFNMENTNTGQIWRFANQTTGFRISLDGTGGPEFEVLNNGNAVLRGTLTENSDVNVKTDIAALDGNLVLAKLEEVPVSEWTYRREGSGVRHIGPMAQDFYAAFGLGTGETTISPRDMAGVNMAAIKALKAALTEKDAQIAAQQEQITALQARLVELDRLKVQLAAIQLQLPQQVALRK